MQRAAYSRNYWRQLEKLTLEAPMQDGMIMKWICQWGTMLRDNGFKTGKALPSVRRRLARSFRLKFANPMSSYVSEFQLRTYSFNST